MPALGGFNKRGEFGNLKGTRPQVPQMFFSMSEGEIVEFLVATGYSEKNALESVRKFTEFKNRATDPKQLWSDDEEAQSGEMSTRRNRLSDHVRRIKGG